MMKFHSTGQSVWNHKTDIHLLNNIGGDKAVGLHHFFWVIIRGNCLLNFSNFIIKAPNCI